MEVTEETDRKWKLIASVCPLLMDPTRGANLISPEESWLLVLQNNISYLYMTDRTAKLKPIYEHMMSIR